MEATKMRVKNKYFSITPDVVEKMKEADINSDILRQRLASGWKFEDAIEASIGVPYRDWETDRKSTRLNSSHITRSRMPSSA